MDDKIATILAESLTAESANAAAVHEEAKMKAIGAQIDSAVKANQDNLLDTFAEAMRKVLTSGDEGTKALLIQKIPLLCTDIMKMKGDLVWIKWLLMGLIGGIGLLTIALLSK